MGKRYRRGVAAFLMVTTVVFSPAVAQDEKKEGVKYKGIYFNVAEDRIIENVGGSYDPESLDKYMKRKFDALEAEIRSVQSRLDQIQSQLEDIQGRLQK